MGHVREAVGYSLGANGCSGRQMEVFVRIESARLDSWLGRLRRFQVERKRAVRRECRNLLWARSHEVF